jgi:formylglycine-generating enzyme required for sulfatase activity
MKTREKIAPLIRVDPCSSVAQFQFALAKINTGLRWIDGLLSRPQPSVVYAAVLAITLAGLCLSCRRTDERTVAVPGEHGVVVTKSGIPMVTIPGGSFEMGSGSSGEPDERSHRVLVSAFFLDQHEVTQADFEKLLGRNPSRWTDPRNPVEQIRWKDAAEFCNARSRLEGFSPCYDPTTGKCDFAANGYRLPTEAEWEYACRAGTSTRYYFGDNPADLDQYAWFKGNCTRGPQPVAQRQPNPWGLHDMCGNVWEWCHDYYQEKYYQESPERDPRGPETGLTRVLRGGGWNSRPDNCRSAYRLDENPSYTDICFGPDIHGFVGFRCARSQAQKR